MKKLILIFTLIAIFAVGSAQNPFKGFFKTTIDKGLLKQQEGTKAIGKPVLIIRPALSVNAFKITKSETPGKTFDVSSFQSGGVGVSLAFFNGTETNLSINALALTPLDLSGATPFSISPALAIEGWNILSAGVGYDPAIKKAFGLINVTYSFTVVK